MISGTMAGYQMPRDEDEQCIKIENIFFWLFGQYDNNIDKKGKITPGR